MNGRLSLTDLAATLSTALGASVSRVGTSFDRDYITAFRSTWPAVWIVAQRLTPLDSGDGFTGLGRQHVQVDVSIMVAVQRHSDGGVNNEAELTTLHELVDDAMRGTQPAGADTPFVWVAGLDGDPVESIIFEKSVYATTVTYNKAP